MSINLSEVDPFSETPMELPKEQESYEGTTIRHTRHPDDYDHRDVIIKERYHIIRRYYLIRSIATIIFRRVQRP